MSNERSAPEVRPDIDTGDTVHHRPTGETWVVAQVLGERLWWCGWPEGSADLADCELVSKATRDSMRRLLERMRRGNGRRAAYARGRLAEIEGAGR